MAKSQNSRTLITAPFRMSFPNVIEAKPFMQDGKPKPGSQPTFNISGIFDPADLEKFQAADPNDPTKLVTVNVALVCAQLAKAEWPELEIKTAMAATWPIRSGDIYAAQQEKKKKNGDAYKGKKIINMKAMQEYPPTLSAVVDGKLKTLNRAFSDDMKLAAQLFQGGHYAVAEVNLSPTTMKKGTNQQTGEDVIEYYVTFWLNSLRFIKQGERFGGSSLMTRFDGVQGGASSHDPTKSLEDEIPV